MDDFGTGENYGDHRDNAGVDWIEIDLSRIKPTAPDEDIPFRLHVNRFESSSKDSERFIHDPRDELKKILEADGFDDDWKVSTFIINHHRTLSVKHVYAIVASSTSEQTAGVTIYKKPAP